MEPHLLLRLLLFVTVAGLIFLAAACIRVNYIQIPENCSQEPNGAWLCPGYKTSGDSQNPLGSVSIPSEVTV